MNKRHIAPAKNPSSVNKLSVILIAEESIKQTTSKRLAKAMLEIHANITLLELQIRTILKVHPGADIIVVTGYNGGEVSKELKTLFPVRFVNNHLFDTTNNTYSLNLGIDAAVPSNLLIISGDIYFNIYAINDICSGKSMLLIDNHGRIANEDVGISIDADTDCVGGLSYGLDTKWGKITFLMGKELKLLHKYLESGNLEYILLHEVLNNIIHDGGEIYPYTRPSASIIQINEIEDVKKIRTNI